MALADNLYGAGRYDIALPIYQALAAGSLGANEQAWVQYQVGGCHRWLGQLDQAERQYRLVISLAGDDPLGGYSRWWLDSLTKRKRVQEELKAITTYLQQDEAVGT
jgi:tetratricopeptide (TPR) repeat protein